MRSPSKTVKLKSLSRVRLFVTPWTVAYRVPPSKNTGVGCHFLLQEIFPTQGLNLGLLHCRHTLYHLSHQGSSKGGRCGCMGRKTWPSHVAGENSTTEHSSKTVGEVKSHFESNPRPNRDTWSTQTNLVCTSTQRLRQNCV